MHEDSLPEPWDFHASVIEYSAESFNFYVIGGSDSRRSKLTDMFQIRINEFKIRSSMYKDMEKLNALIKTPHSVSDY